MRMLLFDSDTDRVAVFIIGRMLMDTKTIEDTIKRLSKAKISEWDIKDQLIYMVAIENLSETLKPLLDKYYPTESFKFEIRRLDELR